MTTRTYTNWHKSSRSDDGNCVEVAQANDDTVGLRDSKDVTGPVLEFSPTAWREFTHHVQAGTFDA